MSKNKLPSGTSVEGHPLAFSMMRICGVDPVDALNLSARWPEGYIPDYVEEDRGKLRMRIALDDSHQVLLTINGGDACISARGQSFPDTAILALSGIPLGKVVDHVLLTGSQYCVREAATFDPKEEGEGTHFHLDGEPTIFVVP